MTGVSRDQGLKRISRVTRWIGVAGIAAAGVFAAIVAKAAPGRTSVITPAVSGSAPSTPSVSPSSGPLTQVPSSGNQAGGGLQAPAQAPGATRGRAAAVSGGS